MRVTREMTSRQTRREIQIFYEGVRWTLETFRPFFTVETIRHCLAHAAEAERIELRLLEQREQEVQADG